MQRAWAKDDQVYLVTASPARDCNHSYNCWGCSSIIDPWGRVVAQAGENDKVIFANIDLDYVDEVRQWIPFQLQKRTDLYRVRNIGAEGKRCS